MEPKKSAGRASAAEIRYASMFKKFFKDGKMSSSYKPVFLYALTDLKSWPDKNLIGNNWISENDGKIKIMLDFIAIRFAKYYWELETLDIRHSSKGMVDMDIRNKDINMVNTVKRYYEQFHNQYGEHIDLKIFANPSMKKFRNEIIKKSIKLVVLPTLLNDLDGLYKRYHGKNYITVEVELVKFMKKHSKWLKEMLSEKLKFQLITANKRQKTKLPISVDNPFYSYVKSEIELIDQIDVLIDSIIMHRCKASKDGIDDIV